MKLLKSLTLIPIITLVALIYVHQQVELVKLSYSIERKEKRVKDMLDRRESLGYNVNNLEAPYRLEQALLSRNVDITFPKRANVVKIARLRHNPRGLEAIRSSGLERKFNLFGITEFLSPRAEAQAKER
ncbi:MAG: hypothetical protein NTW09_00945 [Candidatus Omnitrophica bacterium]|nr:hypothetical protein [Candidatus Omnitrophota bacterium]